MPRARRRAYHHGSLREAVLAEATSLIDELGVEALSVRELGRRLGVSHAAIHHHFPSTEALAAALTASWFGDLDRAMADAVKGRNAPLEEFRTLGVGYVRYAIAHPHRYRMLFRAGLGPEADASFRRVFDAVVACRGRVDPMTTTMLAWSAMHGLAMLWIDGALRARLDRAGIDALAGAVATLISELLAPGVSAGTQRA